MSKAVDMASQFGFAVTKFGNQYWLEIRYFGLGKAPWWGVHDPEQREGTAAKIGVVCMVIGTLSSVLMVRCSRLSTSQTLRFVVIPAGVVDGEVLEAEVRRVALPILIA